MTDQYPNLLGVIVVFREEVIIGCKGKYKGEQSGVGTRLPWLQITNFKA